MLKNHKWLLAILLLGFAVTLLSDDVMSATCTIVHPSSTQGLTGTTANITTTIAISGTDVNVSNVTFWYRAGSSGAFTFVGANMTYNQTRYTWAWNVASLGDRTDYEINVTAFNGTGANLKPNQICSTTATGNTIDNTAPVVTLSLSTSTTEYADPLGVTATCSSNEATDNTVTYLITKEDPDGTTTSTSTNSEYEIADTLLPDVGEYKVNCRVTNEVGLRATTSNETFLVSSDDENIGGTGGSTTKNNGFIILLVMFGVVGIAVLLVFVAVNRKPSKRRR